MDALARLLTPWRLRVYPLALLGAVLVAFAVFVGRAALGDGVTSGGGRVGNDLPAFVGAGRMVLSGEVGALYDLAAQARAQADLLPAGSVLPFAYPPFVAVLYAPLAAVPYLAAYVLHTLGQLAAVAGAVALAARRLPRVARYRWSAAAAAVLFYPLARAAFGGQNTALSLLCAAGAFAVAGETRGADLRRGVWLGLWLFKPQLALPVLVGVALRRPWVLAGAAPVAAGWWALGAAVAGPGWPAWWLREGALPFLPRDRPLNGGWSMSAWDLAAGWVDALGGPGELGGWAAVVLVGGAACALAWRRPAVAVPVLAALAPLGAPHALFYDAGLAILALLVAADAGALLPAAAVWAAAVLQLLPGPWSIAVAVLAAGLVWRRGGPEEPLRPRAA